MVLRQEVSPIRRNKIKKKKLYYIAKQLYNLKPFKLKNSEKNLKFMFTHSFYFVREWNILQTNVT